MTLQQKRQHLIQNTIINENKENVVFKCGNCSDLGNDSNGIEWINDKHEDDDTINYKQ